MSENKKSFSKWSIDDVVETFNVEIDYFGTGMDFWLNTEGVPISTEEDKVLTKLHRRLAKNIGVWNEFELEMHFIGLLLDLVDFQDDEIKSFIEREISATVDGILISGEVDWIISKGFGKPKAPFFCLKEFKKAKNSSNDPEGQLAVAMLAAQTLNNNEKPLYGAYVIGDAWKFVILKGRKLTQSYPISVADPKEIRSVFCILKKLKEIIKNDLAKG
jgi:hypothetical protein